jgi:hypothetical protein
MTTAALGFFNAPNLRRVRKAEAPAQHFVRADGLDTCLACWKSWMASDPDRDLGVKTMGCLVGEGVDLQDIYEAQQAEDNRIGAATDAMINSLDRLHRWAIYRACSIASVWNFPHADVIEVFSEAKNALSSKLKKNICTSVLFV